MSYMTYLIKVIFLPDTASACLEVNMTKLHQGQRIVVFGASGATGRLILEELAQLSVSITAVVRPGSEGTISSFSGIEIAIGSPNDLTFLRQVIKTGDIIISALGQNRATRSPWSAMKSPTDILESSTRAIMEVADSKQVDRVIYLSAYGVGSDWRKLPWWMRLVINMSNVKYAYNDHGKAEDIISRHSTASTILKPVMLVDGSDYCEPIEMKQGASTPALSKINRKAIAKYIGAAILNDRFPKSSPVELRGL
ncbi:MAG: NAD(P)-binding oxidoreductase [Bdellovibrio sp.]|jgi:putative NADH-flavin reductase